MRVLVFAGICWGLLLPVALAKQPVPDRTYEEAAQLFQQGKAAGAEALLKPLLEQHPRDVGALMLMGIVLDSRQRYREAETFYKRALDLAPQSTPLLNNVGNHYLAAGKAKIAAGFYRRVVALDPQHANANLHLAEMSVADKHGAEALTFLNRLPADARREPVAQLLRGQALALGGQCEEASALLGRLQERAGDDSALSFSIGLACAACKRYEQAEASFTRALQTDPKNFDVLYNLGLVARQAGHLERAQQVFEVSLQQKPDDPDALYNLAEVLAKAGNHLAATALLYRLQRLAPERADVLLLLARTTEELGYYEETAATYRQYLNLRPSDAVARREWAFALARAGQVKEALPVLQGFAAEHPKDARGQYELAVAEALTDHQAALRRLDQILTLDPAFFQARFSRAVLRFQEEELAPAMADFRLLLERDPENPQLLDWLGHAYLRTGRAQEAADILKRALERAPRDRAILMHYSRALRELNREGELAAVLATFEGVRSSEDTRRIRRGLFDFLNLSPEEQRARYLNFLRQAVAAKPADATLKARWAGALLEQGRTAESIELFREILTLAPDSAVLTQCGGMLLRHEQYSLAAEFLRSLPGTRLDLAIALFHSVSPEAGLTELDKIPPAERRGDYYVLRAQILDSQGKPEEAADSLNRGIRAAPSRADMYFHAAVFLIKHERREEAAQLLADATRLLPDASELMLARAIALALLQRNEEALKVLAQTQSRWPEWDRPYLIHGIILENVLKPAEAKQMLETAVALGAREADAYYYLALAITHATPENLADAEKVILQAVAMSPEDPNVQWLAGKILLDSKKHAPAIEHLKAAVRLQPKSIRAHYLLVAAYRDLGDEENLAAEAKLIERLARDGPEPERASSMDRFLFAVRPQPMSVR